MKFDTFGLLQDLRNHSAWQHVLYYTVELDGSERCTQHGQLALVTKNGLRDVVSPDRALEGYRSYSVAPGLWNIANVQPMGRRKNVDVGVRILEVYTLPMDLAAGKEE